MNSLGLTFSYDNFDLIWIDGAHGYPVVTADIVNSLNLVNENGLVVCDDVYKSINKSDEMYCSVASYETIRQLYNANLINYSLILKRTIKPWGSPQFRKYIAVLEKCNDVNK
jgi:predicted O-methyltransferase YrrM